MIVINLFYLLAIIFTHFEHRYIFVREYGNDSSKHSSLCIDKIRTVVLN
jgi:hypothetical protein